MNSVHMLKTENPWFTDIWKGRKDFEVREDDGRGYQEGDTLLLQEFDKGCDKFSGRFIHAIVDYIMPLSAIVRLDLNYHQHPVKVMTLRNIVPHKQGGERC